MYLQIIRGVAYIVDRYTAYILVCFVTLNALLAVSGWHQNHQNYQNPPAIQPAAPGQAKAVKALIIHDQPSGRTYMGAAEVAGISVNTFKTHLRRVRQNHPEIYDGVRKVRSEQLAERHSQAVSEITQRSRQWWGSINRAIYWQLYRLRLLWGRCEIYLYTLPPMGLLVVRFQSPIPMP